MVEEGKFRYLDRVLKRAEALLLNEYQYLISFWSPGVRSFANSDPVNDGFRMTSTCSALRELEANKPMFGRFIEMASGTFQEQGAESEGRQGLDAFRTQLCRHLKNQRWDTEGVGEFNLYTSSIVIPTLAQLGDPLQDEVVKKGLDGILRNLEENGGAAWPGYPTHSFLTWRAVSALEAYLERDSEPLVEIRQAFQGAIAWATHELYRQVAASASGDSDRFDVMQLALAAVLYAKHTDPNEKSRRILRQAIEIVFHNQQANGLWERGRPLFHYPGRGDHYTFTFNMLEALLEIAASYPEVFAEFIPQLETSVEWAEDNIRESRSGSSRTIGWVSNTRPNQRAPECWSTVAVFRAVRRIAVLLSTLIREQVSSEFDTWIPTSLSSAEAFTDILDSDVYIHRQPLNLKRILEEYLIEPRTQGSAATRTLRSSALFFGPPGTSKTSWARQIGQRLEWPLITLRIADFFGAGFGQITMRTEEIFERLQRLRHVIILFDEIEELVRRRDDPRLTIESRVLTTTMLPLLGRLHSNKDIVYIATTNFLEEFDPAITRGGRFDLLLRLGPPTLAEKMEFATKESRAQLGSGPRHEELHEALQSLHENPATKEELEYFTYGEWKLFLEELIASARKVDSVSPAHVHNLFRDHAEALLIRGEMRERFDESRYRSRIQ